MQVLFDGAMPNIGRSRRKASGCHTVQTLRLDDVFITFLEGDDAYGHPFRSERAT